MKEVLMALLSKVYKMDSVEAAELLEKTDENEITDEILAKDTARVKLLKDESTKRFDDGHKKGKSEALKSLETSLKEKFEVSDTDLKGLELVEHIVQTKSENSEGKITDDVIKKHPEYLKLENQVKTVKTTTESEWQKKLDEVEKGYKQKEIQGTVRTKALEIVDELNPILPADATKASKVKNWFLNDLLSTHTFEVSDDGTILVLDKEGKRLEDNHGHAVKFEDTVKTIAEQSLEFTASKNHSSAGNSGTNGTGTGKERVGSKTKIQTPKNLEELSSVLNDSKISLEERQEVAANYEAANGEK